LIVEWGLFMSVDIIYGKYIITKKDKKTEDEITKILKEEKILKQILEEIQSAVGNSKGFTGNPTMALALIAQGADQ
jgi:uncharacterized membrane-anchored protein